MGVVGVDVGQQGAHHSRDTRTHILRRETCKVPVHTQTGEMQRVSELCAKNDNHTTTKPMLIRFHDG